MSPRGGRGRVRRWAPALAAGGAVGAATGASAYMVQRRVSRRWRAGDETIEAAGLSLPADARHHMVTVGDGGLIHAVERGRGPAIVLVHGVTLGVDTWAPQLRDLSDRHRVIAMGQRGHGRSAAGADGYTMQRLADDVMEVLEALEVERAVLTGHSMGGMAVQTLAVSSPGRMAARVSALGLLATTPGPVVGGPGGHWLAWLGAAGAARGLELSGRQGRGVLPQEDLAAWAVRATFGSHPRPADLALARSMLSAMSPSAMAGLLGPLLSFDVHDRLGQIDLPTGVVVGSRDLLTPPRVARRLAGRIPGAELTVLPGCGHMVMLERPRALGDLLGRWADRHGALAPG